MARQAKTSARRKYAKKAEVRCARCREETNHPKLQKDKGIVRWVCSLCHDEILLLNGM